MAHSAQAAAPHPGGRAILRRSCTVVNQIDYDKGRWQLAVSNWTTYTACRFPSSSICLYAMIRMLARWGADCMPQAPRYNQEILPEVTVVYTMSYPWQYLV
jgi:hypothetical protein